MSLSRDKLSLIHVAKHQLGMTDEDYRALLRRAGGVSSSPGLDDAGFTAVMADFERLGFRSTKGRAQKQQREGMASAAQIGRIRSLWKSYTGKDDERALCHWLEVHFHVSHPRFLEAYKAGKAIAVLLRMQDYQRRKHSEAEQEHA